jgi:hypothetical protein
MPGSLARLAGLILVAAATGCTSSGPPPAPSPPVTPSRSFDGNYQGMIQLTSASPRGNQKDWCDTPPVISLTLANNTFNYTLAHPNVPQDPNYSMSPSFTVKVADDGSFNATSQNGEAQMVGHIAGSQMSGKINGSACAYAFTANRS